MYDNLFYLEWYARDLLETARAAAHREALAAARTPVVRPVMAALVAAVRARYARWSSAASAGSKPTTARA